MQSSKKPYILFVDDEEMTRKMFERIAGKEFDVLCAESVPAAQKLLDTHADQIGVLLTDQRMPGQLGVELLEYCRASYPGIVRMLTTAYSDLADAIAAVNRGEIIRYIEKPWSNIDALLIDLRVAMRFHLLERENRLLLEEKLSVGTAISRLDRVRSLIEIAAAQQGQPQRLVAIEQMLRDLAELDCVQNPLKARALEELEMFGQPVSDTLAAIGVANGLEDLAGMAAAGNWTDIFGTCQRAGAKCDIQAKNQPDDEAAVQFSRSAMGICAALSTDASRIQISVADAGSGWHLEFTHIEAGEQLVGDWISGVRMDEANLATAGLLLAYLSATASDLKITLEIDRNALLKVCLDGPVGSAEKSTEGRQPAIEWVDDILLLYS